MAAPTEPSPAVRLNILGSGRLGTTLGLLLSSQGIAINDVLNRSLDSARRAVSVLGAGRAIADVSELRPAELTLIATADDAIGSVAATLAEASVLRPGDLIFHCSGATSSEVLAPLRNHTTRLASLHPIQTFTDPTLDAARFAGTSCALEGDAQAVAQLEELFTALGACCLRITPEAKLVYHAGAVFMANYLMALIEAGLRCYTEAGLERDAALRAVRPLVEAALSNAFARGPADALTGPIARGDAGLVARQLAALQKRTPQQAALYATLGRATLALADQKGDAAPEALEQLRAILAETPGRP